MKREKLEEWNGVKLPDVPAGYKWDMFRDRLLMLRVIGSKRKFPFVLWVDVEIKNRVSIGPIDTSHMTWSYRGDNLEEGLNIATTRVLLGMWEDK